MNTTDIYHRVNTDRRPADDFFDGNSGDFHVGLILYVRHRGEIDDGLECPEFIYRLRGGGFMYVIEDDDYLEAAFGMKYGEADYNNEFISKSLRELENMMILQSAYYDHKIMISPDPAPDRETWEKGKTIQKAEELLRDEQDELYDGLAFEWDQLGIRPRSSITAREFWTEAHSLARYRLNGRSAYDSAMEWEDSMRAELDCERESPAQLRQRYWGLG